MDKMEILKLAFEYSETGKEALELARDMEAWLNQGSPTAKASPAAQDDLPLWVRHSPPPEQPEIYKPSNNRRPWRIEELHELAALLKDGKSLTEIAVKMQRSERGIQTAIYRIATGEYKSHLMPTLAEVVKQVNAGTFPGSAS